MCTVIKACFSTLCKHFEQDNDDCDAGSGNGNGNRWIMVIDGNSSDGRSNANERKC